MNRTKSTIFSYYLFNKVTFKNNDCINWHSVHYLSKDNCLHIGDKLIINMFGV